MHYFPIPHPLLHHYNKIMELLSDCDGNLERAAAAIREGKLVAFPTETVYGLGADAFNLSALAKIFEAKKRPHFDPLIIHIADLNAINQAVDIMLLDKNAREFFSVLAEKLWPGPLTLVLPKKKELPALATAGLATAAVRFPSHPIAQKLISFSGRLIAAPSANLFGCLSPTRAIHVKEQLGESVDFIIDGGRTHVGLESTVLDLQGDKPCILRPGGTSREAIEALIGPVEISSPFLESRGDDDSLSQGGVAPLSPGQLKSHYAPKTPLFLHKNGDLDSLPIVPGEGRLYFSAPPNAARGVLSEKAGFENSRILTTSGDLPEAAANLFDMLHELDNMGLKLIRAEEAPGFGLGTAINDRLHRAATEAI